MNAPRRGARHWSAPPASTAAWQGGRATEDLAARGAFAIDLWLSPHCGGRRRLLAAIRKAPTLTGTMFSTQGLSFSLATLLGLVSSNGMLLVLGN